MLISVRGTNGSGKTTVIRDLIAKGKCTPIYGVLGARLAEAYELRMPGCDPVFILGPYDVPTGGCDRITDYGAIISLIQKYRRRGHVIFEGVIVGSVWGRVGELLDEAGEEALVVFLDTSLKECLSRVQGRRDQRKDGRPFNPTNTESKYHAVERIKKKIREAGKVGFATFPSDEAADFIHGTLQVRDAA